MNNEIEQHYQQYKKAFLKIKWQYRIAKISQFIVFGSALTFWIPTIIPSILLFLPERFQIIKPETISTFYGNYTMLYVFIVVAILIYLFSFVLYKVMPALRAKEDKIAKNLIASLFPSIQVSNNIEVNPYQLQNSKIFAWFDPNIYKDRYHGATHISPIYNFGTLKKESANSQLYIADIGIVENNLKQKSTSFLFKVPIINSLLMMYEYGFKRAVSGKLNDQIDFTFRGLFCWAKFNKNLKGVTVVLPDNLEKNIGYLAQTVQALNFKRNDIAYMEDPEFEKEFVVYTTDDMEARYVLSAAMMERMTDLKRKFNRPMMFSFHGDNIHIAISSPTGIFTWDTESLKSSKGIEELHHDISNCLAIVDNLKLEHRVWE